MRFVRLVVGFSLGFLAGWSYRGREVVGYQIRLEQKDRDLQELRARLQALDVSKTGSPGLSPPDDLARIEGIGPKIATLLQSHGIHTFAQLADTELIRLKQIVEEARWRMVDPGTWPQQARLAAEAKWEELSALQQEIKRGRRA